MDYLQSIEKDIEKGNIAPVYLFTGPETYLADKVQEHIERKVLTPGMEALNLIKYDEKNPDYSEVFASCETLPVMSERRIVVLGEQTEALSIKEGADLERFQRYLKNPSPSTVLIIRAGKPDKRMKIFKTINSGAKVLDFKKLDYKGLTGWLVAEVKAKNARIDKGALSLLINRSHYLENEEMDTRTLGNEIERLVDYAGKSGKIDKAAVQEVVPEGVEENVYKIIDAAVTGKLKNIDEILDYFWEHGEKPIGLFSLLLYQLRNIVKTGILLQRGMSQKAMAEKMKVSPYIVRKTIPIAKKYTLNRLMELMTEAADMDLKMKTGLIEPEFGLEYFILKMNKTK